MNRRGRAVPRWNAGVGGRGVAFAALSSASSPATLLILLLLIRPPSPSTSSKSFQTPALQGSRSSEPHTRSAYGTRPTDAPPSPAGKNKIHPWLCRASPATGSSLPVWRSLYKPPRRRILVFNLRGRNSRASGIRSVSFVRCWRSTHPRAAGSCYWPPILTGLVVDPSGSPPPRRISVCGGCY